MQPFFRRCARWQKDNNFLPEVCALQGPAEIFCLPYPLRQQQQHYTFSFQAPILCRHAAFLNILTVSRFIQKTTAHCCAAFCIPDLSGSSSATPRSGDSDTAIDRIPRPLRPACIASSALSPFPPDATAPPRACHPAVLML